MKRKRADPEQIFRYQGDLGREQLHVIEASPLFQENAEPVETLKID